MTWVRLDDTMPLHHKVLPLSDGAFRVHVEAICHAARAETDGHVTTALAKALGWTKRTAELVTAGLWEVAEGGWVIHDYLSYNPSREQLEEKRNQARERMAKARSSREQDANFAERSPNPVPLHPDTSRPETEQEKITPISALRADALSVSAQAVLDSLHEQVHRLVFGGSGYVDVGWCEDLIRRGATQTDVDFAIQQGIPKHSAQYVRAVLESRVKEREQGRDPDAVRQSRARPSNAMQPTPAQRDRFRAIVVTGVDDDGNPIREVAT